MKVENLTPKLAPELSLAECQALAAIKREVDYWLSADLDASFIDRVEGIRRTARARESYILGRPIISG